MGLKLQIAVLAIVVCVNGNLDDNPGCSKEWIKYLIVNACNYSKRSVIAITYMVEDAMEEMNDKFHKITAPNKLDPMPEAKKISKKSDSETQSYWKGPLEHLYGASGELTEEMHQEVDFWERKRRSIKNLIEKCCQQLCLVDDFKGLCFA
ncbi:Hypothetical protein NTJ_04128 [Nesidiocoris tenuis]|uniref:Insulin-like domain-containing protein n=1 Tax=Nesidiocoris tenuis TaxID=355587 RepID=A0ABN7AKB5_9HEMI|nr:Hypothetical protein NTJ_04128 [Nesidiocoris tenuis]